MNLDDDAEVDALFDDLLAALAQQLDSPATPWVRENYERLLRAGLGDTEVREAMARCLLEETNRMLTRGTNFDTEAYRTALGMINPGS